MGEEVVGEKVGIDVEGEEVGENVEGEVVGEKVGSEASCRRSCLSSLNDLATACSSCDSSSKAPMHLIDPVTCAQEKVELNTIDWIFFMPLLNG